MSSAEFAHRVVKVNYHTKKKTLTTELLKQLYSSIIHVCENGVPLKAVQSVKDVDSVKLFLMK